MICIEQFLNWIIVMKTVIFSNIPAPYFVNYLNELGKYTSVLAIFERRMASNRDKSWQDVNNRFDCIFLSGIKIGAESAFSLKIISHIKKNRHDLLIFANPMTPSGIVGIFYCNLHKIPYVIQSEGGLAKNGKGIKEMIKKYIVRHADLCLSGMNEKNDYFIAYGANPLKIKQYPFASLKNEDILLEIPNNTLKENAKRELSISYEKVLIYVGRMLPVKGVDILLYALKGFNDIGVYLIGGNETAEYLGIRTALNLKNIHYVEHSDLDTLKKYYIAADILVLPTRSDTWGLVINEAMSYGLPVITTRNCVAGLELIEDEINGFLIESENYSELHKTIDLLLNNPVLCNQIGKNNLKKISGHTYENMAYVNFNNLQEYIISRNSV